MYNSQLRYIGKLDKRNLGQSSCSLLQKHNETILTLTLKCKWHDFPVSSACLVEGKPLGKQRAVIIVS